MTDLDSLATEMWELAQAQGAVRKGRASKAAPGEDKRAPIEDVISALSVVGNDDGWDTPASWEQWSNTGMAVFAATGGAPEGLEAWMVWSARSELKHDPAACEERWAHWTSSSPPTEIGFGALAIAAGEATRGRWRRPSRAPEREFDHEEDPGEKEGRRKGEEEGEKVPALLTRLGERMVYVLSLRRFFDLQEKHLIGAEQLAAVASNMGIPLFGASGKKSIAALLLNRRLVRHVHGVTMRPGREQIIEDITAGGLLRPMVNRWTPSALAPAEGDPIPWLEHARRLIPDADDFERTIKRQAWILQNPGKKINHALVLVGDQGAGKDSFLKPFFEAIGSHNVSPVKGSMIGGEFNGYLLRPLVFVIEMPPAHKRDVYEEIKGWLTKPPDQVMINEKMIPAYPIPNDANTIISTNHEGAIALSLDDRRIDVVATQFAIEGETAEVYYADLYRWLEDGGSAIVMGWLLRQDVSAFNPHAPPPRTQAKLEMMRHGAHPAVDWAMTLWESGGALSNRELVAVNEIMDMGQHQRGFGASHLVAVGITPQRVATALRLSGWQFLQRVRVEGVLQSVWGRGPVGLLRQLPPAGLAARLVADRQGANAF
jgi:hypothetical protein